MAATREKNAPANRSIGNQDVHGCGADGGGSRFRLVQVSGHGDGAEIRDDGKDDDDVEGGFLVGEQGLRGHTDAEQDAEHVHGHHAVGGGRAARQAEQGERHGREDDHLEDGLDGRVHGAGKWGGPRAWRMSFWSSAVVVASPVR